VSNFPPKPPRPVTAPPPPPGMGPTISGLPPPPRPGTPSAPLPPRPAGAEQITVPIVRLNEKIPLPSYQSMHAAGLDLHAAIDGPLSIAPNARVLVPTGIALALPPGFEGQVRPRSGLAWSRGITVLNSPGTVDADYRGEIKVLLVNLGTDEVMIAPLERIAQLVVARHARAELMPVDVLDDTARGAGGYGSTGT
jgi:dUTP pyrophosphatase